MPELAVSQDEKFMQRALRLAQKGKGKVFPNPLVGACIVKGDKIVGEGYHARFGGAHAEIAALKQAGKKAIGATLYVNLEPCAHHGKTPPCADAIIAAGIKRVAIAMIDPNPLNSGLGAEVLGDAGIEVDLGVVRKPAEKLNSEFIDYITKKK